jgi:uncharacterized membrane protein
MTHIDLIPWFVAWVAVTLVMLILAAYRKHLDRVEDTDLHLGTMTTEQAQAQMSFTQRVHRVELMGKTVTIALVALSIAVFGLWVFNQWMLMYKQYG